MPNEQDQQQQKSGGWWDVSPSSLMRNAKDLVSPHPDTSRSAYGPGFNLDRPSPQQQGEDQYNNATNPVTSPFHRAAKYVDDKIISPFKAGIDNTAHNLERVGLDTHSPLLAGTAKLMQAAPVGNNMKETAQALMYPSWAGMGPEERGLAAEAKLGELNKSMKPVPGSPQGAGAAPALQTRLSPGAMGADKLAGKQANLSGSMPKPSSDYAPVAGQKADRFFGMPPTHTDTPQIPNVFKDEQPNAFQGGVKNTAAVSAPHQALNDAFSREYDKLMTQGLSTDAEKLRRAIKTATPEDIVTGEFKDAGSPFANRALIKMKNSIMASHPDYFSSMVEGNTIAKSKGITGREASTATNVNVPKESQGDLIDQAVKAERPQKGPSVWDRMKQPIGGDKKKPN
jgi:hypothetical protein